LGIAEVELSVFTRQCLNWYIPNLETLPRGITAWAWRDNVEQAGVDQQFTAENARAKLTQLYPQYKEK